MSWRLNLIMGVLTATGLIACAIGFPTGWFD